MIAVPAAAARAAKALLDSAGGRPRALVVLGSGLAPAAERIEHPVTVPLGRIEGVPVPRAPGHDSGAVVGHLGTETVIALLGRVHMYECERPRDAAFAADVAKSLECEILVLTNAAGGLRPNMAPRDFMAITDHLNLTGRNPLAGEPAYVDVAGAYDDHLKRAALAAADRAHARMHQGVYAAVAGPTFETAAEVEMLRRLGADVVGMSTVPETIVARAHGLRVLGISCITDVPGEPLSHERVLEIAREAAPALGKILEDVVGDAGH